MTPKWGFGVAMLPVGALCFYQAHFGRTCFQNSHFGRISSTLYFTVFRSLGGHASARRVSHEPCFRQAHCFVQGSLRFLPVPPNPRCARFHIWGFPTFVSRTLSRTSLYQGKATHPKNTHPNRKSLDTEFAQTLSANLLLILKGKRRHFVYKQFRNSLCKLCFIWVNFFLDGFPFMNCRSP